ncbi:unnamed protein product [Prunus armeniaca]|uniref:R13L1/DRL21-like LRR repeat region domain-containing protein n=1 Tax=Prunus armeniaca TaxID=36596 RepID=A0A6J5TTR6_PRUAR|nr:unnamed protein product [Prunus armeniaca]
MRLTSLRTLDEYHVCGSDNNEALKLGDLGTLEGVSENFQGKERRSNSVEILNALRPHQDLEYLGIRFYHGTTGPVWMMCLRNLRVLILHRWNECKVLPPIGKLPSLERLILSDMRKVKKVGDEFLGIENQRSTKSSSSKIETPWTCKHVGSARVGRNGMGEGRAF